MTYPGTDYPAPGQPGTPDGAWAAPQAEPEKKSSAKKWASLAGSVAVAGVGGAYLLTGGFGIGDPKVDDCRHMTTSESAFEVVDCDSERRGRSRSSASRTRSRPTTSSRPTTHDLLRVVRDRRGAPLWFQDGMITEKGTVYCAAAV